VKLKKSYFCNQQYKPLVAAIVLSVSVPVSALELNAGASLSARQSNNTFRSDSNETDNLSIEPGITMNGQHEGPNLQAALDYQFERRFHSESANNERSFLQGGANINWQALPERLEFNVNQTSTESTRNTTQRGAPNDQGVSHNLSAGPTLYFRVRESDQLRFTYLYEERSSNLSENDSTSDVVSGSYAYQVSESTSITAEHRQEEISFSSILANDLDATHQTLSYAYRTDSMSFELTGGYSEFERDGAETVDGGTGELNWQKQFGTFNATLFATHNISNQTSRLFQNLGGLDRDEFDLFINTNIAEVFTETGYGMSATQEVGATQFRLSTSAYRYEFEDLTADTEEYQISIGATRRVKPNIDLDIAVRYRYSETDDLPETPISPARVGEEGKTYSFIGALTWAISSNFNFSAGAEYRTRSDDFDETVTFATVTYALFSRNYN
jgi:hypothetical protein